MQWDSGDYVEMQWDSGDYVEMQWDSGEYVEMQWDSGEYVEMQWVSGDYVEMQWDSGEYVEMQWDSGDYVEIQWHSGRSKCGLLSLEWKVMDTKCMNLKLILRPALYNSGALFLMDPVFYLFFGPSYANSIKVQLLTGTQ
jgi:hypothetical protein